MASLFQSWLLSLISLLFSAVTQLSSFDSISPSCSLSILKTKIKVLRYVSLLNAKTGATLNTRWKMFFLGSSKMLCSKYMLSSWVIWLVLILLYQTEYIRYTIQNYLINHESPQIFHVLRGEAVHKKGARCRRWHRSWRSRFSSRSVITRALQNIWYWPGWTSLAFSAFLHHPYVLF